MSPSLVIVGFPSTDFVPGGYGQVKYLAGATSAASIPLRLLVVGMPSSTGGISTPNLNVDGPIADVATADTLYGYGGQITRGVQTAIPIPGVQVYGAPVAIPASSTPASFVFSIVAAQQAPGTLQFRIGGLASTCGIGISDQAPTIATNLAEAINAIPRCPFTANANAATVTATCNTPGLDGDSYIAFVNTILCQGVTVSLTGTVWAPNAAYTTSSYVTPATTGNGYYYKCTVAGTSNDVVPTWPTTVGSTVTDGSVTWTCWGLVVTGGGVTAGGGAGLENVTTVLSIIDNQQFDRIALCHNDATNLGRWLTQITAQAGPLTLLLQHVVCATNASLASATSLAQTTLNSQRFQLLWYLNSESHYSELASVFAAMRTAGEAADPDASYDGQVLPAIAAQSQRQDWPIHSTLVSALNNGVTPISTTVSNAAAMVRSITTHSLNGTIPDYSCLDTSESVVPDFCLRSLLLYWANVYLPSNPRVAPDPTTNQIPYVSGVGYPQSWTRAANSVLLDFENGIVGGLNIPPILYNVEANPVVSGFDNVANRIMSGVTCHSMPNQHQIGQSVSQSP